MHANLSKSKKCLKSLPIFAVILMISIITFTYINYYILDTNEVYLSNFKLLQFGICIYLVTMILINYILAIITDPGRPEKRSLETSDQINPENYCFKCEVTKPNRTHHCTSCHRCYLKMDHHCPWLGNCVGLHNQKYFYLFVFYTFIGSTYIFAGLLQKILFVEDMMKRTDAQISLMHALLVLYSGVITGLSIIGVGILFVLQTYLILNNMTSVEFTKYRKKEDSPYYSNCYLENFKLVMGRNCLVWFLPISRVSRKDASNIVVYEQNEEFSDLKRLAKLI
jgi:hypothetical protein